MASLSATEADRVRERERRKDLTTLSNVGSSDSIFTSGRSSGNSHSVEDAIAGQGVSSQRLT